MKIYFAILCEEGQYNTLKEAGVEQLLISYHFMRECDEKRVRLILQGERKDRNNEESE